MIFYFFFFLPKFLPILILILIHHRYCFFKIRNFMFLVMSFYQTLYANLIVITCKTKNIGFHCRMFWTFFIYGLDVLLIISLNDNLLFNTFFSLWEYYFLIRTRILIKLVILKYKRLFRNFLYINFLFYHILLLIFISVVDLMIMNIFNFILELILYILIFFNLIFI